MTRRLPQERPARVLIKLKDGRSVSSEAGVNWGDDASPYTREELRGKFMNLCGRVWPPGHSEQLLGATLGLADGAVRLADWVGLLRRAPLA